MKDQYDSGESGHQQPSDETNKSEPLPAYTLAGDVVSNELGANAEDGLTAQEAKSRLEKHGRNELDDGPGVQPFKILVRQVANAMMLVGQPLVLRG